MKLIFLILLVLGTYGFHLQNLEARPSINLNLDSTWKCSFKNHTYACTKGKPGRDQKLIVWNTKPVKKNLLSIDDWYEDLSQKLSYKAGLVSQPKYTKKIQLGGRTWVDSLHWQSMAKDHFTRYLVTVDGEKFAFVTLTADKNNFKSLEQELKPIIEKLNIE